MRYYGLIILSIFLYTDVLDDLCETISHLDQISVLLPEKYGKYEEDGMFLKMMHQSIIYGLNFSD